MENKTIASISTPLGKGAISIVRMSGSESLQIAQKLFKSKALNFDKITPRMLYYGKFKIDNNAYETCLMVYFKAPFSYTGEDVVEFQVHGGSVITSKILSVLLENGAILAENGEFSKRAFENGKISLDQAESIIDEINAESESELKASLMLIGGKLKNQVKDMQSSLTDTLAEIEATLDYPEEDFEQAVKEKIFKNINSISLALQDILKDSQNSKYIKQGINIAIVGSPNVGKSSLLNSLIGQERAIVTSIAGTTRDVLNESITYKGIKFNFLDTAGIRQSDDEVEKIGIEKSKQSIDSADLILFVLDASRAKSEQDMEIENLLKNRTNIITIVNKIDEKRLLEGYSNAIEISALNGQNTEKIKELIYNMVLKEEIDYSKIVLTNERQANILKQACNISLEILQAKDESMDIVAMLIKSLWNTLGKITGECENERIIDIIFSKFCLGK